MTTKRDREIAQAVRRRLDYLRADAQAARRELDQTVYKAVRIEGVPVRYLAEALGLTRQRIYQMVEKGRPQE